MPVLQFSSVPVIKKRTSVELATLLYMLNQTTDVHFHFGYLIILGFSSLNNYNISTRCSFSLWKFLGFPSLNSYIPTRCYTWNVEPNTQVVYMIVDHINNLISTSSEIQYTYALLYSHSPGCMLHAVCFMFPHLQVDSFNLVESCREGVEWGPGWAELEGRIPLYVILDLLYTFPLEMFDLETGKSCELMTDYDFENYLFMPHLKGNNWCVYIQAKLFCNYGLGSPTQKWKLYNQQIDR